jgi:hypothetical protein
MHKIIFSAIILLACQPSFAQGARFGGKIIDQETGSGVAQVQVIIDDSSGTMTKSDGHFSIILPNGAYRAEVRHIGYHPALLHFHLEHGQSIDTLIILTPRVLPMQGVTIRTSRYSELSALLTPAPISMNQRQLYNMPTAGEPDLMRALQTLPSVTKANELTSRIAVRGSSTDQNLILFDDIDLFNPFHMYGITSSFNSEIIGSATLLPGGFPVEYGNRLGSVLEIRSREADSSFALAAHAAFVSSGLSFHGHIGKKLSYLAAGRINYFDQLQKITGYGTMPYRYYDYNGKISYAFNDRNRSTLSVFESNDLEHRSLDQIGPLYIGEGIAQAPFTNPDSLVSYPFRLIFSYRLHWQNRGAAWVYERQAHRTQFKLRAAYSEAKDDLQWGYQSIGTLSPAPPGYLEEIAKRNAIYQDVNQFANNKLQSHVVEAQVTRNFSALWTLRFGGKVAKYRMNYNWNNFSWDENWVFYMDDPPAEFAYSSHFNEFALFGEVIRRFSPSLLAGVGLRLNKWDKIADWYPDPRVHVNYDVRENLSLQFAAGQYTQAMGTVREGGLFTPIDLYFPCSIVGRAERADHFILSLEYDYRSMLRLSASLYQKNFRDLITRYQQKGNFTTESGLAIGLELQLTYDRKWIHGYLAYTLSRSERNLRGYIYPSNTDQTHRFQVFADLSLGKGWSIAADWTLHTGQPYDPGIMKALILDGGLNLDTMEPVYYFWHQIDLQVKRGTIRYPTFHSLDVGLTKRIHFRSLTVTPYLRVMNAYKRENVLYYTHIRYEYPGEITPDAKPTLSREAETLPIIPSLGLRINYR